MPCFKKDEWGGYWKLSDSRSEPFWINHDGGGHPYRPGDLQKYEIYEADDFKNFVWDEAYLEEALDCGWIDPEGNFWGCSYEHHQNILYDVLKVTAEEAEGNDWIKINTHNWILFSRSAFAPTTKQADTLQRIGRDLKDRGRRDLSVRFEDIFPHGYPREKLPPSTARRVYPEGDLSGVNARPETSAPHLKY